jgi:hypothetical protein
MAITLELKPEVEAELAVQAAADGLSVDAYLARLVEHGVEERRPGRPVGVPTTDIAKARVLAILNEIDRLPRLAPHIGADDLIGYDDWGLPTK